MGLKGEDAQIWSTDFADSTSMSQEGCTSIGSGTPSLRWRITDSAKDVFDPTVTFTVEVSTDSGATWSTASTSNYTLRWSVGVVVFDSDPFGGSTSGNDVRVSGSYLPKHTVAGAFETTVTVEPNLLDITQFQDTASRMMTGVQGLSADFGTYQIEEQNIDSSGDDDGPSLDDIALVDGSTNPDFVFRFEPNNSRDSVVAAWVQFDEDSREASSGDAQSRSFSMAVDQKDSAMSSQPDAGIQVFTK